MQYCWHQVFFFEIKHCQHLNAWNAFWRISPEILVGWGKTIFMEVYLFYWTFSPKREPDPRPEYTHLSSQYQEMSHFNAMIIGGST